MAVVKKDGMWWVDYRVNGKRIRKCVSRRKKDAEEYFDKIRDDIRQKRYPVRKDERILFQDFASRYLLLHSTQKKSFATDSSLIKNLVEFFGKSAISEIAIDTICLIDQYKAKRRQAKVRIGKKHPKGKPISTTTINRELGLMRHMFTKAVDWGYLSTNPLLGINMMYREDPTENILNVTELERLIDLAKSPLKEQVIIALNTGMRKGEILRLKWATVNLEERFIETRSKTKTIRIIPINDELFKVLSDLSLKRAGALHLFENPKTGKPVQSNKTAWKTLLRRAGLIGFRFHDLRHNFATYALLNGGDLVSLQETLGHTDVRTTRRYAKAMLKGQQRLVSGFQIGGKAG
ncbi:MAG: site-specific integrase [bacterium]|nr:site-specific integrase [bacterium]